MKFALASQRSNKTPLKGDQPDTDRVDSAEERSEGGLSQAMGKASIAWAIAAIAWAIAVYLIEREKQRAQVELARLEVETQKQVSSH
jgi:hypothetical protein